MKPYRMEATRTEAGQLGAPSPIVCPPELFAFRIGPRVALTFGALWGMLGARPGSLRISSAAVAGVLCCDARCVRDAIESLVAVGLVERADHSGLVYSLRVNDPRSLAVARRIIDDGPQRELFDPNEGQAAEIPAQKIPPLHVHVGNKSNTCSWHEGPEIPAQKIPRLERGDEPATLGSVLALRPMTGGLDRGPPPDEGRGPAAIVRGAAGLAAELRRRVADVDAAPDRKSTRLNSSHTDISRMPSSA